MTAAKTEQATPGSAVAWIPEGEGEVIEGTVQEVIDAWSDQRQGHYPLLIVQADDGDTRAVHGFTTVLYNELMRKQPMPGDRIRIVYLGVSKNAKAGQNPAKRFRVTVPGREGDQAKRAYARLGGADEPLSPESAEPDVPADASDLEDVPF